MTQTDETLFGESETVETFGRHSTGILPSHVLKRLIRARREVLAVEDFDEAQIQPASLDLRLGPVAWRVRASFLPGPRATVREKLASVIMHEIDLTEGAVLETHCVYVVPLLESVEFSARVSGIANPKSSTGRLDVFTRLITDRAPAYDRIEPGYHGPLYAEISPRTFPVLVRKGSRLNQLRVRRGSPQFTDTQLKRLHAEQPLVDSEADIDNGLGLSIDLKRRRPGADRLEGQAAYGADRCRPPRLSEAGGFLGPDRGAAVRRDRPGPRRILYSGLARSGVHPAGLCRGNDALQSAGGRISRPLRRVFRPRLRP